MDINVWMFYGGFAALAVFMLVIGILMERRRTAQLKEFAEELNFEFHASGADLPSGVSGLHLFQQGRNSRWKNVMRGTAQNVHVTIFDYRYRTGSGKNSSTRRQSVVCFESDQLRLPNFELRPEGLFHKIGGMFGYQDIDFGDYPKFSSRYLLRGENEDAVRQVFHSAVLEHFESTKHLNVEGRGSVLIAYRAGRRPSPRAIRQLFEDAFGVFSILKA